MKNSMQRLPRVRLGYASMTFELERNPQSAARRAAHRWRQSRAGRRAAGGASARCSLAVLWPEFGSGGHLHRPARRRRHRRAGQSRLPPGTIMRIYGARPYQAGDLAQFDRITSELARRAGLRGAPQLYVVPSMLLSAFSIGSLAALRHRRHRGPPAAADHARDRRRAGARGQRTSQRGDLLVLGIADFVTRCAQGALLRRPRAGGAQHPARHHRRASPSRG